jgi:hypothetical protein
MNPSPKPIRLLAAGLAVALSGGGVLVGAAAPSQAATLGLAQFFSGVNFDKDEEPGHTCTQTGPGDATSGPAAFTADGVPVTRTVSSNAILTDDANALDKTTMSSNSTVTATATQSGGQLSNVHIAANTAASLTTAIAATQCGGSVQAQGGVQLQFDLAAPTLVTISTEGHHMIGVIEAGNLVGPMSEVQGVVSYSVGSHGISTASAVLPAGTGYVSFGELGLALDAPTTATTLSRAGDFAADISFQVPGTAVDAQSGSGGKYVRLGAGRDCTAGTLALTWTKKAGKGKNRVIRKARVFVNGERVATIRKPKRKQVSLVRGLDGERPADVEVVFHVAGKGKLETQRGYLRCT